MAKRVLEVKIIGDPKDLERALGRAGRAMQGFGRDLGDMNKRAEVAFRGVLSGSGAFHGLGRAVAFASGTFLGAAGFTAVMKDSVEVASNLNEQISKNQRVFGAHGQQVVNWSKSTAASIGIARDQALEAAGTFGNMLVPMGVAPAKAADMSTSMVKLAADMASFNNADPSDTLEALRSGLAGETEPLRRFGVSLNAARVEAEAMRLGLVKTNVDMRVVEEATRRVDIATAKHAQAVKEHGASSVQAAAAENQLSAAQRALEKATAGSKAELTAGQKAMATYSIVMHDTKLQQDDFARTSGGLANQQRILKANIRDTEASIGKALLPEVLKITKAVNDWVGKSENQEKIQRLVRDAVDGTRHVVEEAWPAVQKIAEKTQALATAGEHVVEKIGGWDKAFELVAGALVLGRVNRLAGAFGRLAGADGKDGIGLANSQLSALATGLSKLPKSMTIHVLVAIGVAKVLGKVQEKVEEATGATAEDVARGHVPVGKGIEYDPVSGKFYARNGNAMIEVPRSVAEKVAGVDAVGSIDAAAAGAAAAPGGSPAAAAVTNYAIAHGPGSGSVYRWGGVTPQMGFDCSGYLYAAYKAAGVTIPRDTRSQWSDPNAIRVPKGQEQPGDGVYFVGSLSGANAGQPPGHVGIYIGGGKYIEYFSEGKPARIGTLGVDRGDYMGARRWAKMAVGSFSSTGARPPVATGGGAPPTPDLAENPIVSSGGQPTRHLSAATTGGGAAAAGSGVAAPLISVADELALARASTSSERLQVLERIRKGLIAKRGKGGLEAQLDVEQELQRIKGEIDEIEQATADALRARLAKLKLPAGRVRAFGSATRTDVERAMADAEMKWLERMTRDTKEQTAAFVQGVFGSATRKDVLRVNQPIVEKLRRQVEAQRAAVQDGFAGEVGKALQLVDAKTQQLLASVRAQVKSGAGFAGFAIGAGEQTPAERQLAQLREQRDEEDFQQRVQALREQGQAEEAATLEKEHELEKRARLEREAADAALEQARKSVEDERGAMRERMNARLAEITNGFANEKLTAQQAQEDILETLDAYGVKFTDAAELLGKPWAGPFSDAIDTATRAVDALTESLRKLAAVPGGQALADQLSGGGGAASVRAAGGPPLPSSFGGGFAGGLRGHMMAEGGDFIVTEPTLFVAGDAGPERATFTPLRDRGAAHGPQPVVQIVNPVFLGRSPEVAREIARLVGPELDRRVGFSSI